ncbi:MAG TPA: DUF2147 domain-containing protein [Polyangiaceae bacterium]
MRHIGFLLTVVLLTVDASGATPTPVPATSPQRGAEVSGDALLGLWKQADREIVIEIKRDGRIYEGTVTRSPRKPSAVGTVVVRGVEHDPRASKWRGEVFAPRLGKFVSMTAELKGPSTLVMSASFMLITKEIVWQRP